MGFMNEHTRIPCAFSYTPSESKDAYSFFLDVLNNDIFEGGECAPAVILGDQSAGLTAAVNVGILLSGQRLQYYNWHAQGAMMTRFRKGVKYTHAELQVLNNLSWKYV